VRLFLIAYLVWIQHVCLYKQWWQQIALWDKVCCLRFCNCSLIGWLVSVVINAETMSLWKVICVWNDTWVVTVYNDDQGHADKIAWKLLTLQIIHGFNFSAGHWNATYRVWNVHTIGLWRLICLSASVSGRGSSVSTWLATVQSTSNWLKKDRTLTGFAWSSGAEPVTTGIDLWTEPFVCDLPTGELVGVTKRNPPFCICDVTYVAPCMHLGPRKSWLTNKNIHDQNAANSRVAQCRSQ